MAVCYVSSILRFLMGKVCTPCAAPRLRLLCGAGGYPPNVLQLTEAYCTNPALVFPFHFQRRSTSYGLRDLYQQTVEL
jgi:hypothetical protein